MDDYTLEKELTFTRFDRMSERYPDRTAVLYLGTRFSFARLRELSDRFAGALAEHLYHGLVHELYDVIPTDDADAILQCIQDRGEF